MSVTGTADGPSKAGCSIADIAAGMYAYSAILNALLRGRTGEGSRIDVSMLESMVEWMGYPMYYAFDARRARARPTPPSIPTGRFPWAGPPSCWACRTNASGACSAPRCCAAELAEDPRFLSNSQRTANREALRTLIVDAFAGRTSIRSRSVWRTHRSPTPASMTWPGSGRIRRRASAGARLAAAGALPALLPPATNSATRRAWIPCRPWAKTPTRC